MNITAELRGVNFRPSIARDVVAALELNDLVSLMRDPENIYDPNAIKVYASGHHIGFIAKEVARDVRDLELPTEAKVAGFDGRGTVMLEFEVADPESPTAA